MNKVLLAVFFAVIATASRSQTFRVVPNSRLAKVAGSIHGQTEKYAVTIGKTIFITCTKEDFFAEEWWVRHEFTHVQQYKKYGIFGFLKRYVVYSIFHSYRENPFEKEAIAAEDELPTIEVASIGAGE
jgi:hypothetical protein